MSYFSVDCLINILFECNNVFRLQIFLEFHSVCSSFSIFLMKHWCSPIAAVATAWLLGPHFLRHSVWRKVAGSFKRCLILKFAFCWLSLSRIFRKCSFIKLKLVTGLHEKSKEMLQTCFFLILLKYLIFFHPDLFCLSFYSKLFFTNVLLI